VAVASALVAGLFVGLGQAGIVSHILGWVVIIVCGAGLVLCLPWYRGWWPFSAATDNEPSVPAARDEAPSGVVPTRFTIPAELAAALIDDEHPEVGASSAATADGGQAIHVRRYRRSEGWDPQPATGGRGDRHIGLADFLALLRAPDDSSRKGR